MSNNQRPFFCFAAFPGEEIYNIGKNSTDDNRLSRQFAAASATQPHRISEHEMAIESIVRINGYDPNHDRGWIELGLAGGREEAVEKISGLYRSSIVPLIEMLGEDVALNPYDYHMLDKEGDKQALSIQRTGAAAAIRNMERAYCESDDKNEWMTDAAWEQAGVKGGVQGFRDAIKDIFVKGNVGGYASYQLWGDAKPLKDTDSLAREIADVYLLRVSPALAEAMGIASDARQKLESYKTAGSPGSLPVSKFEIA